ncbi:hypothetical protein [Parachitinimonas caeni]|uniref:Uncharacterized protein n=1 Tax=Parachitinimonas caeni TaxID=3031301 RepID=A0ABT7DVK9_9NEIS|nr:hypothetical protein [Parachitinimonas caeni]MDK2124101.1 hypothetical protein [Parachitinimonas caeni]
MAFWAGYRAEGCCIAAARSAWRGRVVELLEVLSVEKYFEQSAVTAAETIVRFRFATDLQHAEYRQVRQNPQPVPDLPSGPVPWLV